MYRSVPALLIATLMFAAASPATAVLHIIEFSDSTVTGSFDVDADLLIPGERIECPDLLSDCEFNSFIVSFADGEFTLEEAPASEIFRGYVGDAGFVDELSILMGDFLGSASGAALQMGRDPNTFSINPSGTYTISVPEPGLAMLVAVAAGALAVRRRC